MLSRAISLDVHFGQAAVGLTCKLASRDPSSMAPAERRPLRAGPPPAALRNAPELRKAIPIV